MVADALRLNAQNTLHSYWIGGKSLWLNRYSNRKLKKLFSGKYDDGNSQWEYINSEDRTHIDALVCAGSGTSGYALVINKNGVSTGCFGRLSKTDTEETSSGTTYPLRAFCESKIVWARFTSNATIMNCIYKHLLYLPYCGVFKIIFWNGQ